MSTDAKKESILFLVNPKSGVGGKKRIPQMVERYIDHNRYDADIRFTEYAGHAYELAKDAVARGIDEYIYTDNRKYCKYNHYPAALHSQIKDVQTLLYLLGGI